MLLFPHKLQVFTIFILIRAIWWPLRGKIHAIRCYISIKTVIYLISFSLFPFPFLFPHWKYFFKKGCIIWQIVINYAHDFFKFLFKTIKLKMSLWCSMIYFYSISNWTSYDSKRKLERAQFMSDFELEMNHFRNNHAQVFWYKFENDNFA